MKVLVLSDIHGNLEAMEAVLEAASGMDWKELWFLGDLCGYGPDPEACYRRLIQEKHIFIPGNHDLYLCGRMKGEFFSTESHRALILSRSLISGELVNHMKQLPAFIERKGFLLLHGSPEEPSRSYILGEDDALRNFKAASKKWILFGHTHIQEHYSLRSRELSSSRAADGDLISLKGVKILINPGSVGQPRDNNPKAAWGVLDTGKKEFNFYRTAYDYTKTQAKMKDLGFSDFLIERISRGV
ncbi:MULTISPECIES: metallophosphoesterase [unclassified Oceanispirochaeta]|uniref:metallophosphoesterase family protein n=1 Tax=unclassified Oceanispirochaeta TaxID=2635722 RepID=UPI000E09A8C4|nr:MULTISPECIES: metallophosphoesterase family protein [unclassified Oceanispirochaeta]MBF9015216.1 metallophosphoesterase family protein [Oceanispirochaeta sp. M2]NPD71674.1 metallophosphoesterase [Oceanispirochaeta sp. M1]RDG32871.1 metallophosphoesterase [Oceanispirochaeta sp. M1]